MEVTKKEKKEKDKEKEKGWKGRDLEEEMEGKKIEGRRCREE